MNVFWICKFDRGRVVPWQWENRRDKFVHTDTYEALEFMVDIVTRQGLFGFMHIMVIEVLRNLHFCSDDFAGFFCRGRRNLCDVDVFV